MNQPARRPVLRRLADNRYTILIHGPMHDSLVDDLETMSLPSACRTLLVDLREATVCTPPARHRLVSLQRRWTLAGIRTAWLSDRASLRGAALWILHQARDEHGRSVGSLLQATRWLDGAQTRAGISLATLGVTPRRRR